MAGGKKGLAALAEQAKAAEAQRIRDVINNYKVSPDNWLGRLGQRSAQQLVLKDPTQNSVHSWQLPHLNVVGQTFNPNTDRGTAADRKKRLNDVDDPLQAQILRESGYDLSGKTPLAGKIMLAPEATNTNNFTPEHEYTHRGAQELNKDLSEHDRISSGEYFPYLYPEVHSKDVKKLHPADIGSMNFKDMYDRLPSDFDKEDLARVLELAKKDYADRYLSGPGGGEPDIAQPHLGYTPPTPPSFMDHLKDFMGRLAKAAGGTVEIDDRNPAKRRRII